MDSVHFKISEISKFQSLHAAIQLADLTNIATNEQRGVIVQKGALPALVKMLKEGNLAQREIACRNIWYLARNDNNKTEIGRCGAISKVIQLAKEGDAKCQETAAAALVNIAANTENKILIAENDGIGVSISLLKTGTPITKEFAAATLWNLSVNNENKIRMVREGVLTEFMGLLKTGTPVAKEKLTGCLGNLALNPDNKSLIVDSGFVPELIKVIETGTPSARQNSALMIANLASSEELRLKLVDMGVVPPLVELLKNGTPTQKEKVCSAFWNLAVFVDPPRVAIVTADALPSLVETLRSGTPVAKDKAAGAIWNLTVNQQARSYIMKAGALLPLINSIRGETTKSRQRSVPGALQNLAINFDAKEIIAKEATEDLMKLIRDSNIDDETKEYATATLQNLAVHPENKKLLRKLGVIECCIEVLNSTCEKAKDEAASTLWNLSVREENKQLIVDKGGKEALERVRTTSSNSRAQEKALQALAAIRTLSVSPIPPDDSLSMETFKKRPFVLISFDHVGTYVLVKNISDSLRKVGCKVEYSWKGSRSSINDFSELLQKSCCLIVCLTELFQDSPRCRTEIQYSLQEKKVVIPILLQNTKLRSWISNLLESPKPIDFSNSQDFDKQLEKLVSLIPRQGMNPPPKKPSLPSPTITPTVSQTLPPSTPSLSNLENLPVEENLSEEILEQEIKKPLRSHTLDVIVNHNNNPCLNGNIHSINFQSQEFSSVIKTWKDFVLGWSYFEVRDWFSQYQISTGLGFIDLCQINSGACLIDLYESFIENSRSPQNVLEFLSHRIPEFRIGDQLKFRAALCDLSKCWYSPITDYSII